MSRSKPLSQTALSISVPSGRRTRYGLPVIDERVPSCVDELLRRRDLSSAASRLR
jgi:hypothetical protein